MDETLERELEFGEQPDLPVGTVKLGEPEHACCYGVTIKRLSILVRGDGSRRQIWNSVAEFADRTDAEICLRALQGQASTVPDDR